MKSKSKIAAPKKEELFFLKKEWEMKLQEKDFEELAREGVRIVGEIGLGAVKSPKDAAPMVKWAKKYGMVVMMHTGGTSIPGSSTQAFRAIRCPPMTSSMKASRVPEPSSRLIVLIFRSLPPTSLQFVIRPLNPLTLFGEFAPLP
jgi:hypothetical protein